MDESLTRSGGTGEAELEDAARGPASSNKSAGGISRWPR